MIKIANTIKKFKTGINGIFFIFDGRFTSAEITAYNLITKILFPDCTNQLYLIRNRFKYCTDVNKCKNDIEALKQDNFTAQIFNDVKTDHLIYVDSNEEVMDRYNYTHTCLLSLINKLDNIYLSLPYKEIVKKIEDKNENEAGAEIQDIITKRIEKMGIGQWIGIGVDKGIRQLGDQIGIIKQNIHKECLIQ